MNPISLFHQVDSMQENGSDSMYFIWFVAIAVRERPGGSRIGQSGEDLDFFIGDEAFNAKGTRSLFLWLIKFIFDDL